MRIVSLIPSATEIICSLGLFDQLVGVTHECDWPSGVERKSIVTNSLIPQSLQSGKIDDLVCQQRKAGASLYSLDFERMRDLRPDLIVSQTLCDVCAVDDAEVRRFSASLESNSGVVPRTIYLEPRILGDVLRNIQEVADAAGVPKAGERAVAELQRRIDHVNLAARTSSLRSNVVVLEWLDPLFSCGHWTPELVELAGGTEPLAHIGERSRRISIEELVQSDPDLILIACCGFSIERTMPDARQCLQLPQIQSMRCVRNGNVRVTDGSAYFSRPGPRLVDSLEILANAMDPKLHPLQSSLQPALNVSETLRPSRLDPQMGD